MPTTAGGMTTTPGGNPQWRAADGSIISAFQNPLPPQTSRPHAGTSYGSYRDWVLRMGYNRTSGLAGWRIKLPLDPGGTYYVTTADDTSDSAAGITTDANHPPAGVK